MKQSAVIQWLLDESQTVLKQSNLVSLSNPSNHVDVAQPSMDHPYPFVGVQPITNNSISAGIGSGKTFVDGFEYDNNGVLQAIVYRRDSSLRVNVIPVTDNDASLRDDLAEEIADHFNLFSRTETQPTDMDPPEVDETSPQGRPDEFVRETGVTLVIEYEHTFTDSDPMVADSVNMDIEVGDEVSDLDTVGDDPIAFSESFN